MPVAECFGADWAVLFTDRVLKIILSICGVFFVALLGMNLVGATQDIATDGLAVNILQAKQQHWVIPFRWLVHDWALLWVVEQFCGHWIG